MTQQSRSGPCEATPSSVRGQGRTISRLKTQGLIRISVPTLPLATNSPELCMLDVCNKTSLRHKALERSDQLMFSGHFRDLKAKGTLWS